jgi:hypothetical protein
MNRLGGPVVVSGGVGGYRTDDYVYMHACVTCMLRSPLFSRWEQRKREHHAAQVILYHWQQTLARRWRRRRRERKIARLRTGAAVKIQCGMLCAVWI